MADIHAEATNAYVRTEMLNELPAPAGTKGPVAWMRENLFSSIPYTILTLICLYVLYKIIPPMVNFLFLNAQFVGEGRAACSTESQGGTQPEGWFGACWPYVGAYANQLIYGRYPAAETWRVNVTYFLFFGSLIPLLIPSAPFKRINIVFTLLLFPIIALILLTGGNFEVSGMYLTFGILAVVALIAGFVFALGSQSNPIPILKTIAFIFIGIFAVLFVLSIDFGLERVGTENWGGLLVTLVVAVTGIAASLPIGIALALGRRSQMPIVKFVSVIFIEFWRGVPLITVLFMASVMLPLFLSDGVNFDKLMRALIGVALFQSAYMAEVIRGGLQALPKGQYEGAMALGLNWGQMMRMIILPQALTLVIPGIVNTFIGLFKDTTLVSIIGLFDLLGTVQSSFSDPTWASPVQGLTGYAMLAIVYFIFCYAMSRYSMYMERRLDTGHKR